MGAKPSFRSPNGGVSLFVCSPNSERGSISSSLSSSIVANFQTIGANFRQKGAKVNDFLGVLGVFSGFWETEKGKSKHLFCFEGVQGFRCGSPFGAVVVSTGCRWCRVAPWCAALVVCSCLLSPLLHLLSCISPQICLISRFKGVFSVVLVCLCGFVLSWCFAWLVWLLCAWVVRRFKGLWRVCLCFFLLSSAFLLLCLSSGALLCYPLLVLFACLVCSCVLVGFCVLFFPYGLYAKKKGRKGLSLASSLVLLWVFRFLYSYWRILLPLLWLVPTRSVCTPKQYSTRRTACLFLLWFSPALCQYNKQLFCLS